MSRRTVFFVSERTGVTAETLGKSLLTQFEPQEFDRVTVPFTDTVDKADAAVRRINAVAAEQGTRPIIFSTLLREELRACFIPVSGLVLDFFEAFLAPLESELQTQPLRTSGHAHGVKDRASYERRIEATHFALGNDDGASVAGYESADVILIGVSRTGKTPTCLYLALTYGVFAANYPLSEDELESGTLPKLLEPYRAKLYGLTIAPERLQQIRKERRPVGRYSTAGQVRFELRSAEALFCRYQVPYVDTTAFSIEEIASTILSATGIERRTRP